MDLLLLLLGAQGDDLIVTRVDEVERVNECCCHVYFVLFCFFLIFSDEIETHLKSISNKRN